MPSDSQIERLIEGYDGCCLECDGMTRVLHTVLEANKIRHKVYRGKVTDVDNGDVIPLHFWIRLPNKHIVDYRAQMWLGSFAPHGVFDPEDEYSYIYEGRPTRMPVLDQRLFQMMTGGCSIMNASERTAARDIFVKPSKKRQRISPDMIEDMERTASRRVQSSGGELEAGNRITVVRQVIYDHGRHHTPAEKKTTKVVKSIEPRERGGFVVWLKGVNYPFVYHPKSQTLSGRGNKPTRYIIV